MLKDPKRPMSPGTSLMMCPEASVDVCTQYHFLTYTFTFTFRAFSRHFYPKQLTISTFVIRSATIHRYRYSEEVHRTKY